MTAIVRYLPAKNHRNKVGGQGLAFVFGKRRAHKVARAPVIGEETDLLGTPVAFFDTAGCEYFERTEGDGDEGSRCNENEAQVVKGYVEQLVRVCWV